MKKNDKKTKRIFALDFKTNLIFNSIKSLLYLLSPSIWFFNHAEKPSYFVGFGMGLVESSISLYCSSIWMFFNDQTFQGIQKQSR
jgi:hypothetical protein